ncbi:hypothetical protein BDN72DRAFT_865137 [Pluteus cervinus]|uniref:Uncharacterized protein n=1 Tax=Pluteus cervinus TaxID=181527 RepID=A0ACD3A1A9_9AGAR|nr:hypothetical protein BDN72DRAFT_865137 [Pluteus cervinus]
MERSTNFPPTANFKSRVKAYETGVYAEPPPLVALIDHAGNGVQTRFREATSSGTGWYSSFGRQPSYETILSSRFGLPSVSKLGIVERRKQSLRETRVGKSSRTHTDPDITLCSETLSATSLGANTAHKQRWARPYTPSANVFQPFYSHRVTTIPKELSIDCGLDRRDRGSLIFAIILIGGGSQAWSSTPCRTISSCHLSAQQFSDDFGFPLLRSVERDP